MAKTFIIFLFIVCVNADNFILEKVVILGRHNIRTPLTSNLERLTSNTLPKWKENFGFLTKKGTLLETYMGAYFSAWLNDRGLIKGCPKNESVFIYSNAVQRTKESAKAFARSAFKDCNVTVNFKNIDGMDPIFHPVLRNESKAFKEAVIKEMQDKLNSLNLNENYELFNEILNFNNSNVCKDESFCDLVKEKTEIVFELGEEPNVKGPLKVTNDVADLFLMSFYQGFPFENIAWGKIKNEDQWKSILEICKENQNVRFNSSVLAKDVAFPLLSYMTNLFKGDKDFVLLVGHDSNINSVLAAIGFEPYILPGQEELTPVGGKLVFQKLLDKDLNKHLLKIDYVYQTMDQLRSASRLTLQNPPLWRTLHLKDCKVNANGFCLWGDFLNILNNIY